MAIRLKFGFLKHYWWILISVIATALWFLLTRQESPATIVTVLGSIISIVYFVQKQKLEELRLFREVFKEFNARYDEMNEELSQIVDSGLVKAKLSKKERETLVDYFNLCGEEYLYFERGYIDPIVWRAWENGMKVIFSNKRVSEFWAEERATDSYYGLPL